MSFPFNPKRGLVIVQAQVWGPTGSGFLRLALDTGATGTVLNATVLVGLGYNPALAAKRIQITTGSGVEFVPRLPVDRIDALGHTRSTFPILCHTLPPSASVDGLLGLNFFRGRTLGLDFRTGQVTLAKS